MAQTPPAAGRPGRQLIVLGLVSAFLFAMLFFSGTGGMSMTERLEPRLGMDLVGGTRVTLLAATEGDQPPSEDALARAREIIESRVNALGVEEAEVVSEGDDRIVVSVAGEPENALRSVGQPAELRFRKVIGMVSGMPPPEEPPAQPETTPGPSPGATGAPPDATTGPDGGDSAGQGGALQDETEPPESTEPPGQDAEPQQDAGPEADAQGNRTLEERRQAVREKIDDETMAAAMQIVDSPDEAPQEPEQLVEQVRQFQELTGPEVAVLPAKLQFYLPTVTCQQLNARPAGAVQDPDEMAVACNESGFQKYLLDEADVLGTDVADAHATIAAGTNQWQVNVEFTGDGQPRWTDLTREATQNDSAAPFDPTLLATNVVPGDGDGWQFDTSDAAVQQNNRYQAEGDQPIQCSPEAVGDTGNCLAGTVLDNEVISAPEVEQVITGNTRITGDFGAEESQLLASQLRFGALPLTFEQQEGQSISATLGVEYLKAGLWAAAIGLGLVILYVFFYYRLLGTVILGSLVVSSILTYAALVVLGRGIGYTLTLAGIAGFIVAVGIAADSFVIYFERLKDEIRDGRTARSAVPRAWVRARRTIITANAVTLMAAGVLYLLSAGQVRGFAFALGLATVLDLLTVFTFRHPIMTLLARTRAFLSPTVSGLGRALELDRAQRARVRAQAREVEA